MEFNLRFQTGGSLIMKFIRVVGGKCADSASKRRYNYSSSPKTDPPMAASPPILTPASIPTGPPRQVPRSAPATGYTVLREICSGAIHQCIKFRDCLTTTRGAIHQLLNIIFKLRILVLLPVSTMHYVVKVKNYS
jgi:hypothetical protein